MIEYINSWLETLGGLLPGGWGETWIVRVLVAAVVTLVFWLLVRLARGFIGRLVERIRGLRGFRIRALKLQDQDILTEKQGARLVATLVGWSGWLVVAVLFYGYLQIVFSLFPATQGLAEVLLGYVVLALRRVLDAVVGYIPRLITLIVILFAAKWVIHFVKLVFAGIQSGRLQVVGFYREWATPTFGLVRIMLIALAAVVAFPYLPGSGSQAFRGVSIFLGVLFSLASTGVVANVISGMALTYTRAFRDGDVVKIADTVGIVQEKTTLVTRIQTHRREDVSVPNSMVLGSPIVNYTTQARESGVILHTSVTIGYDVPWRTVHEAMTAAAERTEGIEAEPAPFVRQTSLDDFYAAYELNAYTRTPEAAGEIYSRLHQNLQDSLHAVGIEIASPHLSAVRDGNTVNVPPEHRPKDYEPAVFRLGKILFPGSDERKA